MGSKPSSAEVPVGGESKTTLRYGDHPAQVVDIWWPAAAAPLKRTKPHADGTGAKAASSTGLGGATSSASDEVAATRWPVAVVMIHGGFWQDGYARDLEHRVVADLVERRCIPTFNIEYRRVGTHGAGQTWHTMFDDVEAAVAACAKEASRRGVSPQRLVLVGHSAGGHLAAWYALRRPASAAAPVEPAAGAAEPETVLRPLAVVSQAGVLDLAEAHLRGVGGSSVKSVLQAAPNDASGPGSDRCAEVSPAQLIVEAATALGTHRGDDSSDAGGGAASGSAAHGRSRCRCKLISLVHGLDDGHVPPRQSRAFVAAAERAAEAAGTPEAAALLPVVRLVEIPDEDHFAHLDPASRSWAAVVEQIEAARALPPDA